MLARLGVVLLLRLGVVLLLLRCAAAALAVTARARLPPAPLRVGVAAPPVSTHPSSLRLLGRRLPLQLPQQKLAQQLVQTRLLGLRLQHLL
jgi:hypothetical protein